MTVSDYIIKFLKDKGVHHVYMLAGGQAMFLNDALAREPQITPVCVHHEQAAAMAAEAHGRVSQDLGVALVTAGPAGVNALNGVVGAYVDSSPMMIISGQSHLPNVKVMEKTGIRQCGLQGIYMKPLGTPVTKYFVTLDDPADVAYHLEKAYVLATTGRKGPVWIDVPLDIQRMEVPEKLLRHYDPEEQLAKKPKKEEIEDVLRLLKNARKPLIYLGQGVRIAGAETLARKLIETVHAPVVTARLGIDLIESDHPLFVGRPGLYGDRYSNAAVQLADVILIIGARLDPGSIGWDAGDWGRNAIKIVVDIDEKELLKLDELKNVKKVHSDAHLFLSALVDGLGKEDFADHSTWIDHLQWIKQHYPTVDPTYMKERPVNSYFLSERLSALASSNDSIVVDTSSPFHVVCQAWKIKKGQHFLTTGGISTMGYWVAAIGASYATKKGGQTIVVTGDGCLQMNIQEFATIAHNKIPLKIFVINNNGYLLIRHTQKKHMESRFIGESPKTGVWCPKSTTIAKAYGLHTVDITSPRGIDKKIQEVLDYAGPVVCDVLSPEWQVVQPYVSSQKLPDGRMVSKPFEDLFPFLPEKEMKKIMNI